MSATRDIKKRIKSVSNTKQIAKAMEVVSATKMKRAQELAVGSRPFTESIFNLISQLPKDLLADHELVKPRVVSRELFIVITSDKGLAGVYNGNVLKNADNLISSASKLHPCDIITIGRKAKDHYQRRGENIIKEFSMNSEYVDEYKAREISEFILSKFKNKNTDKITLIYTDFISTLKQEIAITQALPINQEWLNGKTNNRLKQYDRKFEPLTTNILDLSLNYLFHYTIYKALIEANASEHSARMLAMKKASDNASDIVSKLTLDYNKSRQAGITQELIEIVSGSESI